jgi:hypothetical protein
VPNPADQCRYLYLFCERRVRLERVTEPLGKVRTLFWPRKAVDGQCRIDPTDNLFDAELVGVVNACGRHVS